MAKKFAVYAMLIAAAFMVITACSSNKSDGSQTGNTGGSKTETSTDNSSGSSSGGNAAEEQKDTKKHTITYLGAAYGAVFPADGKGIQLINEKFNVDYKPTFIPNEQYSDRLTTMIAGGDMPDIAKWGTANYVYKKWAKEGGLLALDEYIENDPYFDKIPDAVWDQVRVDGKIYAIPKFFLMDGGATPVIRKDWLDNLGLDVPTNYDELKQVAIAFAKNDPDGNGKDDTYGWTVPWNDGSMGAYWLWWHYYPDKDGSFKPNIISEARKEVITFLHDLYEAGAIAPDFATKTGGDAWMEFWSGKSGIYHLQSQTPGTQGIETLLAAAPNAELVAIPPFKAPDGTQGYAGTRGYYDMTIFNAKLAKDPDKVKRIIDMIKFGTQFYPLDQRNQNNPDFDWLYGHYGEGYTLDENGLIVDQYGGGKQPREYLPDSTPWPEDVSQLGLDQQYSIPQLNAAIKSIVDVHSNSDTYLDPFFFVNDPDYESKWYAADGFENRMITEQVKMIVGQRPISDWDKVVKEWEDAGAKELYERMAKNIADAGITPDKVWVKASEK
jgi:putative aldouronate transport system substrate-binding protein